MSNEPKNFLGHMAAWITWPRFIFSIVMFFFLTSILFPFYWMVSSSFKTRAEIAGREPVYIPEISSTRSRCLSPLRSSPLFWPFSDHTP
jgi:ABC-type glycerol-3-phosphate transport system permease component